jgi:hypothetical protein
MKLSDGHIPSQYVICSVLGLRLVQAGLWWCVCIDGKLNEALVVIIKPLSSTFPE